MSARNDKPIALLSPAVGTPNVGDHFIELAIRRLLREGTTFRRFSIRKALSDADLESINQCSCALLCGTNLYQHDWHSKLTVSTLDRMKAPVIPFGLGGSAKRLEEISVSRQTGEMIRALHARCELGGVRDPHAEAVVAAQGVENFLLTGCPVLFWAGTGELPPIHPVKRSRIIVTARNWLMHHWPHNVDHPVQMRFLRAILDHFPPEQLVFTIHEEWDERLIEPLKIPKRMLFRGEKPDDFIRLYCDPGSVVLAMRLHAGMLAVANGVPALFIGHDTRTYSFCDMIGLEYIELFSNIAAERTIERLEELLDGTVAEFESMQPRFRQLRSAMRRFLKANNLPAASL